MSYIVAISAAMFRADAPFLLINPNYLGTNSGRSRSTRLDIATQPASGLQRQKTIDLFGFLRFAIEQRRSMPCDNLIAPATLQPLP